MTKHITLCLLSFTLLASLTGCASRRDCVTPLGPSGLTPAKVSALGQGEGVLLTWGGVIANTRNLPELTEIEIIGYPLDDCGEPRLGGQPTGRFIARQPGFLEPNDYRAGRPVTVTGRIAQPRDGRVGEASYRFPVLEEAVVRLWRDASTSDDVGWSPKPRPWISIGIGSGGIGGGVGLGF